MTETAPLRYHLDACPPEVLEVGDGNVLLLRGWALPLAGRRARGLLLELGPRRLRFPPGRDLRPDVAEAHGADPWCGFFLAPPLRRELAGQVLRLRLALEAGPDTHDLLRRKVRLVDREPPGLTPEQARRLADARVVICMTTNNPDPRLFRQQVESLRAQTVRDWACLIQDDCSRPESFRTVRELAAADPRFLVFRNEQNLGFYRNFGACLARVPPSAPFVALCDQDDRWDPDKLEASLAAFSPGVELVYSDMRLTDEKGRVLRDTYWFARRNNFRDLDALLVSNTVTGAASVFRGALLRTALPFPPAVGRPFHDHWLACVALCRGRIAYVDRPLYDYTQHRGNVVGHCEAGETTVLRTANTLGAAARHASDPRRLARLLTTYYEGYRQLHLYRELLRLRLPDLAPEKRRALDLFDDSLRSGLRLITETHGRILFRGQTTDMAELWLGLGLLSRRLLQPLLAARLRAAPPA